MTWDNINLSSNPFFFLKSRYAEEAITALGLGYSDYKNKELLAFFFQSTNNQMHRPTICDSDYNIYWRPTLIDFNDYGLIKPLNNGLYHILGVDYEISNDAKYLPESVNFGKYYSIKDILLCNLLKVI